MLEEANAIYGNKKNNAFDILVCLSENANQAAGGMYFSSPQRGYIIMQFGDFDLSKDTHPLLNILYHEISHHFQNTSKWNKMIKKYKNKVLISKNYSIKGVTQSDVVDEIINASLWGEFGVLSQKAFSISDSDLEKKFKRLPAKNRKYYDQIKWCAYKFRPITQKIIRNKTSLSDFDILQAIKIWNTSNI